MRIDLHVHTRERSSCAHSTTEEMIRAAIEADLDGVVLTDHDRLVPKERLRYLNAKYEPFRVFGGVEVTTRGEHILVLGIEDPAIERGYWDYPELHRFVIEREGFLAVAHPYRFDPHQVGVDLERFPPHGLELCSRNTPRSAKPRIRELSEALQVVLLSNSDAHHVSDVGRYYNALDRDPEDIDELVSILKEGAFEPVAPTEVGPCFRWW